MRADAVAFRHELSRRAVEAALPVAVRMQVQRAGARRAARRAGPRSRAGRPPRRGGRDEAAVVAHAPAAARAASRLGAHAQEVALQEQALAHRHLLDPAEEAALWQERAMALFSLDRVPEALEAGRRPSRSTSGSATPGRWPRRWSRSRPVHWALVQPGGLAHAERARRGARARRDAPSTPTPWPTSGACRSASTGTRRRCRDGDGGRRHRAGGSVRRTGGAGPDRARRRAAEARRPRRRRRAVRRHRGGGRGVGPRVR